MLCRILSTSLKVRCFGRTGVIYDHPSMINRARIRIDKKINLKTNQESDWYIDKLHNNYEFSCKPLYKTCKFIYLIRTPQIPLATLISRGYPPKGAETYYLFRLRRMCEMAVHTDGSLLTYEDLVTKRAFPLLQNALSLKSPFSDQFTPQFADESNLLTGKILKNPTEPSADVPSDVIKRCMEGYKRYLKFLESKTGLIRFAV